MLYRRGRITKRYGALLTCLTTRAVHLDLAQLLSTEDFLLVVHRFIGVDLRPIKIVSDNGTNFIGRQKRASCRSQAVGKGPRYSSEVPAQRNGMGISAASRAIFGAPTKVWFVRPNWLFIKPWTSKRPLLGARPTRSYVPCSTKSLASFIVYPSPTSVWTPRKGEL